MANDLDFLTEDEARLFKELQENEADDVKADIARAASEAALTPEEPAPVVAPVDPTPAPAAAVVDHTPPVIAGLTPEEEAKLSTLDQSRSEAISAFGDGDLTSAEFEEKLKAIETDRLALTSRQAAAERALAAEDEAWAKVSTSWMAEHPEITELPREAFQAFDAKVQVYTSSGLTAGQSYRQQLDTALALFLRENPDAIKTPETAQELPQRPEPPKTLAGIPAAGLSSADDAQFSALDALADRDAAAYEDQLARLKPDQLDAYLRQGAGF